VVVATPRRRTEPGDALLHPAILLALLVLVLNDHVLKSTLPGPLTGKLSDVAGVAFFPALLLAGWELALAALGRFRGPSTRALVAAVIATGVAFVLVKTTSEGAAAFGWLIGSAQWLSAAPFRLAAGSALPPIAPAVVAMDATDLIALPAVSIALVAGWRRPSRQAAAATVPPVPARVTAAGT
jgi:hypothetical protein